MDTEQINAEVKRARELLDDLNASFARLSNAAVDVQLDIHNFGGAIGEFSDRAAVSAKFSLVL
ncbi:MAG TPA: hypothetical protein VJ654_02910 [Noviherbaspirillum sp.]|nr:hypothetical protein [Noviherbaspirillum sp.]